MSDAYVVYRGTAAPDSAPPYAGRRLVCWYPRRWTPLPRGLLSDHVGFVKNWVYYWVRLGPEAPFRVYRLVEGDRTVSQCIVTDASPRFPFMRPGEWQIGLVHTPLDLRGRGLGRALVRGVLADLERGTRCWWLTEVDNRASRRLIESVGFEFVGGATRKTRRGAGYFALTESPRETSGS